MISRWSLNVLRILSTRQYLEASLLITQYINFSNIYVCCFQLRFSVYVSKDFPAIKRDSNEHRYSLGLQFYII